MTLAPGTGVLGYEWDEDADNGFRPTGLIDMSSTTAAAQVFTDYGNATQNNVNKTHHLTLYKAPSGALVFGAGTVQWAWGLDSINPPRKPVDVNMQQATMNLFADMHAQPSTPISGLVPSPASTDTTAPTSTITSPAPGATIPDGTPVTISGTATDAGGGVVAGVEISTDGGTTWHPATGTNNWTYSWIAHGSPSTTIRTRASDDSANVESPKPGTTVNVTCPCSIWSSRVAPVNPDSNDGRSIEVGMRFKSDAAGFIRSIRFYKAATNTGTHTASLWTAGGQLLGTATFTGESASGWQQADFASPIAITANTTYVASYHAPSGHYSEAEGYFYGPPAQPDFVAAVDSAPLHALHSTPSAPNGLVHLQREHHVPDEHVQRRELLGRRRLLAERRSGAGSRRADQCRRDGRSRIGERVLERAHHGRSAHRVHRHAVHRQRRPDHRRRSPALRPRRRSRSAT